jgi:flagellar operon protein
MLGSMNPLLRTGSSPKLAPQSQVGTQNFRALLQNALGKTDENGLNVSSHAEKRLTERHISMDGPTKNLLMEALDELKAKGARDSLVLTRSAAFVLNVPSRTLVTAMDLSEMKDRIVTNIDSVSVKNA